MSPGGVTEIVHFRSPNTMTMSGALPAAALKMKILRIELPFRDAVAMIADGFD